MYLHLGKNTIIHSEDIIGIFDLDTSTICKSTRNFLTDSQKENNVTNVSDELPKSFVVCSYNKKQKVYLSQMNSTTLLHRSVIMKKYY